MSAAGLASSGSRTSAVINLRWPSMRGARYRVLVLDALSGEFVLKAETDKPHLELPAADFDRSRRYTWRPQIRTLTWWRPRRRKPEPWRDLLPELRVPLPPPEGAAVTPLDLPADEALAHRVVIRDETDGEIAIADGVLGDSYLVNWAELEVSHRHRFKVQRWSAGRWLNTGPYSWLYPPQGALELIGMIDKPVGGGRAVGMNPLDIRGWAICCRGAAVARVEIVVSGSSTGLARLGLPRPEVSAHYSHADAPICGFAHRLAASQLPPEARERGEVTIEAVVDTTEGRRSSLGEVTARVQMPAELRDDSRRPVNARPRSGQIARRRGLRIARRLLAFSHKLDRGGASLYLTELLARLVDEHDFSCTLVSALDGPLRGTFERSGVSVPLTGFDLTRAASFERGLSELCEWAAGREFDLVLGNTLDAAPAIDLAARLGIPGVLVVHESVDFPIWTPELHWGSGDRYVRERVREALGQAATVVFVAEATRRQYVSYGEEERFVTIPPGIPLERMDARRRQLDRPETRRKLGIPERATVILCLGKIEARKSQTCLAQAFSRLADAHPDAVLFLIGDHNDEYSAAVRDHVQRAKLSERVAVLPVVSDPFRWHEVADLVVSSSDNESLPRVVLEAMAFERPVVAASAFGVTELIEDGKTGYLCTPRDLESLIGALDRALSAPASERRAIALAGAEHVRKRHDHGRYVDAFGRLLHTLIADPGAYPTKLLHSEPALTSNA